MRTVISVYLLAAAACLLAGCATTTDPLVGTWERLGDDGRSTGQIKVLNETHFAFGAPDAKGEVPAGGGTWHREGDSYFETVFYHYHPLLAGMTIEFGCRVEGDLWYHTGDFETLQRGYHIDEVWRRIVTEAEKED